MMSFTNRIQAAGVLGACGAVYAYYSARNNRLEEIENEIKSDERHMKRHAMFEQKFRARGLLSTEDEEHRQYAMDTVSAESFLELCREKLSKQEIAEVEQLFPHYFSGLVRKACETKGRKNGRGATLRMFSSTGDHCGNAIIMTYVVATTIAARSQEYNNNQNAPFPVEKVEETLKQYRTFRDDFLVEKNQCKGKYLSDAQIDSVRAKLLSTGDGDDHH